MGILDPNNYNFANLDYFFWSGLINALVAFVSGAVVLNKDPSGRKNIGFFLFAISVFAWSLPYAIWQLANTADVALFWTRTLMGGAIFVTVAFLNFTLEVLELKTAKYRMILLVYFLVMEFFALANLTPLFVSHVEPAMFFEFWPQPGILYLPFLIIWLSCFAVAGTYLVYGIMESDGQLRQQRKLIFIGFAIGIAAGSTNYFLWFGIEIAPWLNLLTSIYVLMVSYAMLRHNLFQISPSRAAPSILAAMADALFIVNEDYRITVVNKGTAELLGLPENSFVGKRLSTFLPGANTIIDNYLEQEDQIQTGLTGDRMYLRSGSGRNIPISLSISSIRLGKVTGFVLIGHDISDMKERMALIEQQGEQLRVKTEDLEKVNVELVESRSQVLTALESVEQEKELAEREHERSQTILRSIGDGVFVVDRDGQLVMINTAAENMIGKVAGQVVGQRYQENFKFIGENEQESVADFVGSAFDTGEVTQAPHGTLIITANNRLMPVAVTAAPLIDNGVVFGAVAVIRDETKQRAIDRAKSEFVSIASHQLRTPLSSMKWMLEMFEDTDTSQLNDQQRDYISMFKRSIVRMSKLVNDLLNISQIESGQITLHPVPTDMDLLCEMAVREILPVAQERGLNLHIEPCQLGEAHVDANLIRNVIYNLLSNALKYTPSGGTVVVCGERGDCEITIWVSDTGIGVPPEEQEKVFNKFFRGQNVALLDTEGRGLGLYIVKSIVESSGGRVWLDSEVGQGSKFYLTLPIGSCVIQAADIE